VLGLSNCGSDLQRHADLAGITEAQHAILRLLADGLTLKEIVGRLAPGSARLTGATTPWTRLQRAMRTLGAKTPEHAIAISFRRGILR
jgi:DNA-binding NarL/FixJ family response regulator